MAFRRIGELIAQLPLANLARRSAWQSRLENDVLARHLVPGQLASSVVVQTSQIPVQTRHDDGHDPLTPTIVGQADDRRLAHCLVGIEHVLHLSRVHVLTTGNDHVFDAVHDIEPSLRIEISQVPGEVGIVLQHAGGQLRLLPITSHDVRAGDDDFSDLSGR